MTRAHGKELSLCAGSFGQFLTIIGESLAPGATVESGYFSMLVSAPASGVLLEGGRGRGLKESAAEAIK